MRHHPRPEVRSARCRSARGSKPVARHHRSGRGAGAPCSAPRLHHYPPRRPAKAGTRRCPCNPYRPRPARRSGPRRRRARPHSPRPSRSRRSHGSESNARRCTAFRAHIGRGWCSRRLDSGPRHSARRPADSCRKMSRLGSCCPRRRARRAHRCPPRRDSDVRSPSRRIPRRTEHCRHKAGCCRGAPGIGLDRRHRDHRSTAPLHTGRRRCSARLRRWRRRRLRCTPCFAGDRSASRGCIPWRRGRRDSSPRRARRSRSDPRPRAPRSLAPRCS